MQNTGGGAVKRIYVKVFGFSDVERHALNTVFRLSATRSSAYALWSPEARDKASVLLLDGESWEAALELANPANDKLKLIWVGEKAPSKSWKAFSRPLQWAAVVEAMDRLHGPAVPAVAAAAAALDLDLDFNLDAPAESATRPADLAAASDLDLDLGSFGGDYADTDPASLATSAISPAPAVVATPAQADSQRVLIVDADRDARLYMRAKLATAGLPTVDEAATGAEAQQLLRFNHYKLVVLDLELADFSGWKLLQQLRQLEPRIPHVIITGQRLSPVDTLRARFGAASGALAKPLDPVRLHSLLRHAQRH
jgi:CheY-like chemotaxis protein